MVIGFHLSWTTYGHWFPHDPRGSWSDEVWQPRLAGVRELDDGRNVTRPRPVHQRELQRFLDDARAKLRSTVVTLDAGEIKVVGHAFAECTISAGLVVRACAILPNHVHIVVDRHSIPHERVVGRFKGRSSQRVRELRGLDVADRRKDRVPIWTRGYWVRYVDNVTQMERAIEYVRENPVRERLGHQHWDFVG